MKLPKIFHRKHTIAGRLTWRVVGTMTVVMTIILVLIFTFLWLLGAVLMTDYHKASTKVFNEKLNNIFSIVEVAVSNNMPEVEENINNEHRQYFAVEHLLRLNPNIMGAAVAYNPDYEPKKGQAFSPYAYRDSMSIHTKQLNTKEYDYLHQEWYTKPIEQEKGTWSEPYMDEGGGDVMMITYSQPIINSKGEIYAIQTADIALNWLNDFMQELDSTAFAGLEFVEADERKNNYSFIVTRKGAFVAHPDETKLQNQTLYDFLTETGNPKAITKAKKIIEDDKPIAYFSFMDENGVICLMFLTKIEHTDWMMCNVVPFKNILYPASVLVGTFVVLMIIGLIIVSFVCRSAIRRGTKPITQFAESADEIASGNLSAELPTIKTKDEMLRLHNSYKTMQKSLIQQIEETKSANEEKGRI